MAKQKSRTVYRRPSGTWVNKRDDASRAFKAIAPAPRVCWTSLAENGWTSYVRKLA